MNLRTARLTVTTLCMFVVAAMLSSPARAGGKGMDVTISKDEQMATIACDGNAVTVRSKDNILILTGDCVKLTVAGDVNSVRAMAVTEVALTGSYNTIIVDTATKITISGHDNTVTWKTGAGGKPPDISNKGKDNRVRQPNN